MSGLSLNLAPKERFLINGAVIEAGPRRSRITVVTPNTRVLRMKDAIHPESAETPLGRICYTLQLVLSGDSKLDTTAVISAIDNISSILVDVRSQQVFESAKTALKEDKPYTALKLVKQLLPIEKHLLELRMEKSVSNRDG
ncbi:flagellar biosynthesis repressor FlbT [Planktotalea sp.]|uniref:flagellar biosynthesis repressor FlbT n=1 Tax=Planktotalea sp. TaxID=2029877 RepID=UPI003F6AEF36